MKVCPTCQQTYADDELNFCLNDGAVLINKNPSSAPTETVFMNQPLPMNSGAQSIQPPNWGVSSAVSAQAKPKSKTWLWILGIFAAIILLCGGGLVSLIAIVANTDNKNTVHTYGNSNLSLPANNGKIASKLTDDLSTWKLSNDSLGTTDYKNNEFYMTSKPGGYYFVLMSGNKDFRTDNATTWVNVRNVTGTSTDTGYGLMVHNNIATALAQDYAFLIDSVSRSYRIVKHQARKETVVIKWTGEESIKNGSQTNALEVRDTFGKMSFYINGKFITTVTDTDGIKSGVAGLYAGGATPIAFSNLQIEK